MALSHLLALCLGLPTVLLAQNPLRIMPTGDSITHGGAGCDTAGGYRDDLYYSLLRDGIVVDMVGTLNDGEGFDADHEGHGGWTADRLLGYIDSFLVQNDPDIVLLHIGTNDISADQGVSSTVLEIGQLIERVRVHSTSTAIFLAGIIPRLDDKDSLTSQLNAQLRTLVAQKRAMGYNISYVDHNGAFKANPNWQTDYMSDVVHPNCSGYAVMARTWHDSLDLVPPPDTVAPATVGDLGVDSVTTTAVALAWRAPGDDGSQGFATEYDIRYSTGTLDSLTFPAATPATGEPPPALAGTQEHFLVTGLLPGQGYSFALVARDEVGNASRLSNVARATTDTSSTTYVDNFNRALLGESWSASPQVRIADGECGTDYNSARPLWSLRGIFREAFNPQTVSFRLSPDNTEAENGAVGLLLRLDTRRYTDAQGYMVRYFNGAYHLRLYQRGALGIEVGSPVSEPVPPRGGDVLTVRLYGGSGGHHFAVFKNNVPRGILTDPDKVFDPPTHYAGIAFENDVPSRVAEVDDWVLEGAASNEPPTPFVLLAPADRETVDTPTPTLVWQRSTDPDGQGPVKYILEYSRDSTLAGATTFRGLLDTTLVLNPLAPETTYFWRVTAFDPDSGMTASAATFRFRVVAVGVGPSPRGPRLPASVQIGANYPNPFNPRTTIPFAVPEDPTTDAPHVRLSVYSLRGHRVRTLVDGPRRPGWHRVTWDGRDDGGTPLPSGVYVVHLEAGAVAPVRKIILAK